MTRWVKRMDRKTATLCRLALLHSVRYYSSSLMIADSLEGLGCLADDIRVFAGCGFA
jgi:hypothetical protein